MNDAEDDEQVLKFQNNHMHGDKGRKTRDATFTSKHVEDATSLEFMSKREI